MPASLITQIAHHITALHRHGSALLATHDQQQQADVHHVQCLHTPQSYFVWVADYTALAESTAENSNAILLLSHEDGTHLSWVGTTHAVAEHEPLYAQMRSLLQRHLHQQYAQVARWKNRCLLQLVPQYGRFSRQNQQDVLLNNADLNSILNWQAAA